jgi:hypothetical protein
MAATLLFEEAECVQEAADALEERQVRDHAVPASRRDEGEGARSAESARGAPMFANRHGLCSHPTPSTPRCIRSSAP